MEYKQVEINLKLNGIVTNTYQDKGITYVTLNNSQKIWFPHSRNYNYKRAYLNDFMQPGDSIIKGTENDTLKIYRGRSSYYFVIGKFIDNH